jgi:DNA-binding transcriptional ArsR family regulator
VTATIDQAFAAVADPTRRAILRRLAHGAARVTDVSAPFDMSLAAVSKHIRVLERAGLVRRTRSGREHSLEIELEPLREVARWVGQLELFWTERLDRLQALFARKQRP